MSVEPLGGCHCLDGMTDVADALLGDVLEGDLAAVAVEVDTIVCHGISVGGQGVVGAAGIVAGTLAGLLAKEHAARIDDLLGERLIVVGLDDEMLGGIGVGEVDGLVVISH